LRILSLIVGWTARPSGPEVALYSVVAVIAGFVAIGFAYLNIPKTVRARAARAAVPDGLVFGMILRPEFGAVYTQLGLPVPSDPRNVTGVLSASEFQIWDGNLRATQFWTIPSTRIASVGKGEYFVGMRNWPTVTLRIDDVEMRLCPLAPSWYRIGPMSQKDQQQLSDGVRACLSVPDTDGSL